VTRASAAGALPSGESEPVAAAQAQLVAPLLKSKLIPLAMACVAFAALTIAPPASAVTGPLATVADAAVATINGADTAWILVSSALVLFMSIPGCVRAFARRVFFINADEVFAP
jgi:Amt family ammonium transporter